LTVNRFGHKTTQANIDVTEDTMYAEERQQAIAALVAAEGRVSVSQLADRYAVTTETVRRDLSTLERAGLVRRVHGGVVPADALRALETAVTDRDRSSAAEKDRIAAAALEFVPVSGTVVFDAGTTTARLAALLPLDQRLGVITHAVPIAARLAGHPTVDLRLLPGRVRRTTQAAVGEDTVAALSRLRTDVAFVGTNGVSARHGLSTPDHGEAAVKAAIVAGARRVVLLADADKLGDEHLVRFAAISDLDVLVTDTRATTHGLLGPFEDAGVKVVVA
jgi:DeoR family transcriptional regulator, fructose operon transcriptional repressor